MRVLVCGGRSFTQYETVERYLDMLNALYDFSLVIHGNSFGADRLADCWAHSRHIDIRKFPALWTEYKKAAGPIRNKQMLDEGQPELVVVFPGRKGTGNMRMQALETGVEVIDLADERVRLEVERKWKEQAAEFRRYCGT